MSLSIKEALNEPVSLKHVSNDLTQQRWQNIKSFEHLQRIEKENYKLRQDLKISREKEYQAVRQNELIKESVVKQMEAVKECRRQMNSLRDATSSEIEKLVSMVFNSKIVFKVLKTEHLSKMNEFNDLKSEIQNLKHSSTETRVSSQQALKEIEKLKGKLSKSNSDMADYLKEKENMMKDLMVLRIRAESDAKDKQSLEHRIETLTQELKNMKSAYSKLEQEAQTAANTHETFQQINQEKYNMIISDLQSDNESLRGSIRDMQEQIERLNNEMLGKKSHFAKFVELKSENIQLQNKLTTITNKIAKTAGVVPEEKNQALNGASPRVSLRETVKQRNKESIQSQFTETPELSGYSAKSAPRWLHSEIGGARDDVSLSSRTIQSQAFRYDQSMTSTVKGDERSVEHNQQAENSIDEDVNLPESRSVKIGVPLIGKQTRDSLKKRSAII